MPTTYKNAQLQGTAAVGTYGTLYSTDGSTTAVLSTISICNTSASSITYRIAIMGSAGTPSAENWIVSDAIVAGKNTAFITAGITLGNTQFLRVSSSGTDLAFSVFISEIT